MKISDMLIMCLRNLWRRKGRTLLTVVGVVIGSCAVIVMISLGLGMNEAMDSMLSSWGDLTAVTIYNNGVAVADVGSDKPKLDDAALKTLGAIDHVSYIIPRMALDSQAVTVSTGKNERYSLGWGQIIGVDLSMLSKMGYYIKDGKEPDPEMYKKTVIFGSEIAYQFRDTKKRGNNAMVFKQQLSDGSFTAPFFDPLESDIKFSVNNTKKPNDEGGFQHGGRGHEWDLVCPAVLEEDVTYDTPYAMLIDISTAKEIIEDYNKLNGIKNKSIEYSIVKLSVDDLNNVEYVQKQVEDLGYSASSMAQMRNEMQGQLGTIELVLGCLAAISLLVAAISITNTMIMSTYERTREIGIMKVLGCYIGNIRLIFLIEAGLIGLLGGIIGTIISYIISFAMNSLMDSGLSDILGFATQGGGPVSIIPVWLVLLALGFSTLIGLISGYYPANRAVRISALEAIKNE